MWGIHLCCSFEDCLGVTKGLCDSLWSWVSAFLQKWPLEFRQGLDCSGRFRYCCHLRMIRFQLRCLLFYFGSLQILSIVLEDFHCSDLLFLYLICLFLIFCLFLDFFTTLVIYMHIYAYIWLLYVDLAHCVFLFVSSGCL